MEGGMSGISWSVIPSAAGAKYLSPRPRMFRPCGPQWASGQRYHRWAMEGGRFREASSRACLPTGHNHSLRRK